MNEHLDALSKEILELKKEQDQLEAALKLRDEFFSAVAHELRNPLNALHLTMEGLLRAQSAKTPLSSAQLVDRVNRAAIQVKRLAKLVDDMLNVSRIAAGRLELRMEEFDLSALLNEVVARFNEQAGSAQISLSAGNSVMFYSDRTRMDHIITNLLSNALQYGNGNPVEVRFHSDDTMVRLEVVDHGIGIAPQDRERIFDRFERVTKGSPGLGVGLWVARETVHALRGRIRVESEPGAGSTFTVQLPRLTPSDVGSTPIVQ
jgi:signal transduction histidine kinase